MPEPIDLSEVLFSLTDVPLGSLVLDPSQPHEDSFKPAGLAQGTDFSIKINKHISWSADSFSSSWLSLTVLRYLKLFGERRREDHLRVTADSGAVYHLAAPERILASVCTDPKARAWFEEAAGAAVYMVTELCTMVDPALDRAISRSWHLEGQGPVIAGSSVIEYAKLTGGRAGTSAEESKLVALGERIYKIKFRRVKRVVLTYARCAKGHDDLGGDEPTTVAATLKKGCRWVPLLQVSSTLKRA